MLHPLKFKPILKEMIWGGTKIPTKLNLQFNPDIKIGENYAISGLEKDTSVVSEGELAGENLRDLIQCHKGNLVGHKVYDAFGATFPLLIKYIDAQDDLSIQVHPNDIIAKKKHNAFGKTEMWYVIESDNEANLISGFTKQTTAQEFQQMHKDKKIMELMKTHPTKTGDIFYIPAGKVHSIGKNNLIAEIQQTSDITYRIYDFDRKDKEGKPRELHQNLAMDAMNFLDDTSGKVNYSNTTNVSENAVKCDYFTTNVLNIKGELKQNYKNLDSFVILMNVGGKAEINSNNYTTELHEMEAILIPAILKEVTLSSKQGAKLLEVYL